MSCNRKSISDLTGIEHFTALEYLDCGSNLLTTLDVSANTALESLDCGNNQLTTLDVSKNTALKYLSCEGNQLTTLDVSAVPALKDAVENGTKDDSEPDYDEYYSAQGMLFVAKDVTILTAASVDTVIWKPGDGTGTEIVETVQDGEKITVKTLPSGWTEPGNRHFFGWEYSDGNVTDERYYVWQAEEDAGTRSSATPPLPPSIGTGSPAGRTPAPAVCRIIRA